MIFFKSTAVYSFIVLFLLMIAITPGIQAQSKSMKISGQVVDSLQKPLAFATVNLYYTANPGTVLQTTYTSDAGKFSFNNVDSGNYILEVTHTGFAEHKQDVTVKPAEDFSTGAIRMMGRSSMLQGVTVTARKPLIEQLDDKIIFNVENDPATKTETAIDILRKTPFVSVDGENNIQVNGQSNFKVLLNGKETAMFAQNVKEALKGFPGALITKIEVITSPSAKYDAEGVGGIINIITRKKVAGYNGSLNLYYSNTGWYNVNTNFSAKFGKLGITVNYGAGGGRNVPGISKMQTTPFNTTAFTNRLLLGSRRMNN